MRRDQPENRSDEGRAELRNRALARVGAVVLVGIVALVAAGAVALQRADQLRAARSAFAQTTGRLGLPGLEAPVEVLRDDRGIPHIEALREEDAWIAVGFVHAQDRLEQMLWLRRLARGQTAELVGEAGVGADRLARTIDFAGLAARQLADLDPDTREVLRRYAQGVNGRLARIRAELTTPPHGIDTTRETFEPWSEVDSLAIFKLIAWGMGNQLETNLVLDDLIQSLGGVLARPFKPTGLGVQGVEVPPTNPADLERARGEAGPMVADAGRATGIDLARNVTVGGGTAWVLSGRRTRSGAPILVADLQLPPTLPALVHELHMRGGSLEVAGVMVPGVPIVWAGRGLHVAWAITPGRAVTVDLYRESVRLEKGLYQNGRRWVPFDEREETIVVATPDGGSREEVITVRSTRHGPIVNELLTPLGATAGARRERDALALAWTGMRDGDGMTSLLAMLRARSSGEITEALETHHEPVVAVVHADVDGKGGMQLAGWLPYRPLPSGFVPVPGRTTVYDWRVPIDFLALPAQRLGSEEGRGADWVIAADNPLDDDLAGGRIEWLWRADAQAKVLRDALRGLLARSEATGEKVDLRAAAAVQTSVGIGPRHPLIVSVGRLAREGPPLSAEATEILDLLEGWDGRLDAGSRGAAAWHMLLDHLIVELFEAPLGPDLLHRYLALPGARPHAIVTSIVTTADRLRMDGGWTDVERITRAVRRSLRATWVSLGYRLGPSRIDWSWGGLHHLHLRPFASFDERARIPGLPAEVSVGGDGTTPRVTRPRLLSNFETVEASTYMIAIDLAAPDRLLSSLLPGQSEHARHPNASDGIERWKAGRPSVLLTSRLMIEEASSERLILDPPS